MGLEKYKVLCKDAGISEGKLNEHFLFTLENADYFYFNKNIGVKDILEGFVDGSGDGGIDFIYSEDDILYLLQGKSSTAIDKNEIDSIFNKITSTIEKISKNKVDGLSQRLVQNYLNAYDSLSEEKKITLVLFTNSTIDKNLKNQINELKEKDSYAKYSIIVYDALDIEAKKLSSDDIEYVNQYKLELTDTQKGLKYNDNGLVVNASANSIKKLYNSKSDKGLFSYNLREHIRQANVDNAIEETIKKEPNNFWFYNNGITIGCEDFIQNGNNIILYNFSIINGAQTTTNIGKSDYVNEDNDFSVVCKIVKPSKSLKTDYDFLMRISEASNSQKPIKPRDLKANLPEQKILQNGAANNGDKSIAIEIKRGVRAKNYNRVPSWARVTNDLIGQLILSCILQHPGDAKTSSSAIFGSQSIYVPVFRRNHDFNTLYDLVNLYRLYEEFRIDFEKETDDIDLISVSKAGRFTIFSTIFYFYKIFNSIINGRDDEDLYSDNISGNIFSKYDGDDFDNKINDLFRYIIRGINDVYQNKKNDLKLTSHASFLKNDSYYKEHILKLFDNKLKESFDYEKLRQYMEIFNIKQSVKS